MPKNPQIDHVLVIGSGPIVIGQASEFDYSGTQACRVLKQEGVRVSLINSNPATIMTDPEFADATYVEPITADFVEKILAKEAAEGYPVDAILATLGGQTALNTAMELAEKGILSKYKVELIGADIGAIKRGEDRQMFKDIVSSVGGESARSKVCYSLEEALKTAEQLNYPVVVRPSFTMGGLGSGMAYSEEDLIRIAGEGLHSSPTANVLIEESIIGWKEFELELMRDHKDNTVVVCSIENFDAVGVHTGDSITVAPAMTLTDREYQHMRDMAIAIIREVGVSTGGCNIQFAVNPTNGRLIVIEMNPRVSRSSALASKATGFPIAKIATKLAIGYSLDEIVNDITKETPACFEPALDYVVVKAPRFAFEKFPSADPTLTTTMKSVGEAMAFGRSFKEALNKALRSLETKTAGFRLTTDAALMGTADFTVEQVLQKLLIPTEKQIFYIELALRLGASIEEVVKFSKVDAWFIAEIADLVKIYEQVETAEFLDKELLLKAKSNGISDSQIAALRQEFTDELAVRAYRKNLKIKPVFKTVDTCAAEFEAQTPYHYSTYETDLNAESELKENSQKAKVMILGSGPNRIGQGIEFDYSCVHAAMELSRVGYETIMVNCNPETVSTDYDTSDRLFFEPLTFENVMDIIEAEKHLGNFLGVIVTLGGQTPLGLAKKLEKSGVTILGTSPESIDLAEDRAEFEQVLEETDLPAPPFGMASTLSAAQKIAKQIGYPVLARPSFVLGGRGMEIVYNAKSLQTYIENSTEVSAERPVLIDRFLEDAIEIDVDALCDGKEVYLGAIMEHIEEAGIHSGDSACSLPPITIGLDERKNIALATKKLALALKVNGLINIQFALKDDVLYVLEANPRASRTVPFVSKATGISLAKACSRLALGETIAELVTKKVLPVRKDGLEFKPGNPIAVKEAVLPFHRFRRLDGSGVDTLLGPEMKSTGEVMGISPNFSAAFAKGQIATFGNIPTCGNIFVSVSNRDKRNLIYPIKRLQDLGFNIYATEGTGEIFALNGIECTIVRKFSQHDNTVLPETDADTVVEKILANEFVLVINTPVGNEGTRNDGYEIRNAAMTASIPCITTARGASALAQAIDSAINDDLKVGSLQEFHQALWS